MASLKIPGVIWISLLVALSAFITANWPDALWLNLVTVAIGAVAIGAVIKALEVQSPPPSDSERLMTPGPPPSKTARWLMGG